MTANEIMKEIVAGTRGYFVEDNISLWYSGVTGWYVHKISGTENINGVTALRLVNLSQN